MGKKNSNVFCILAVIIIITIPTWNMILRSFVDGYLGLFLIQTISFVRILKSIALGIHYKTKSIYLNPFTAYLTFPAAHIMILVYLITKDKFPFDFFTKDMLFGCWGIRTVSDWFDFLKTPLLGVSYKEYVSDLTFSFDLKPEPCIFDEFGKRYFTQGLSFHDISYDKYGTHLTVMFLSLWKIPYSIYAWVVLIKGNILRKKIPKLKYMESEFYNIQD